MHEKRLYYSSIQALHVCMHELILNYFSDFYTGHHLYFKKEGFFTVSNCIIPMGFLPWETWVAFSRESQLQQSHITQPTVHAGCFSFAIIPLTLTWTTGSLTCTQTLMHAIAHGGVWANIRESALKVGSGRKIPCCTRESNQHQQHDGPMLYQ